MTTTVCDHTHTQFTYIHTRTYGRRYATSRHRENLVHHRGSCNTYAFMAQQNLSKLVLCLEQTADTVQFGNHPHSISEHPQQHLRSIAITSPRTRNIVRSSRGKHSAQAVTCIPSWDPMQTSRAVAFLSPSPLNAGRPGKQDWQYE